MTRTRTLFYVLVVTVVGLTTGVGVGYADTQADAPYNLEAIASITGGDVGQHVSIAFNENTGKPYVSYYDETNQDLRLIYPHDTAGNCGPDNKWYCEAPDTAGDVGQYSSIDYFIDSVTGAVKIGIAYFDATNEDLKVAIWSASPSPGWTVSTVLGGAGDFYDDAGRHTSLKFDSNGTAHVAFAGEGYLMGAVRAVIHASSVASGGNCGHGAAAGRWQCEEIVASFGAFSSLDLTSMDVPVVAFITEDDVLKLCGKVSGSWSCVHIDLVAGPAASLAIDQSDLPHIGYYDYSNGKLKYATYVGTAGNCGIGGADGEYQCDIIDSIGDSQSLVGLSVDVDPEGYPVIAYQDDSDPMGFSVLNVARPALAHGTTTGNCGPIVNLFRRWQCTTIDDATQGGGAGNLYEADYAAVGIDPDGVAYIAYYEEDDYNNEGRLKLAHQEVADPIFSDDFETGTVAAWTSSVGGP
jgi:hypothetical protein